MKLFYAIVVLLILRPKEQSHPEPVVYLAVKKDMVT
jgi:hypothetical protein